MGKVQGRLGRGREKIKARSRNKCGNNMKVAVGVTKAAARERCCRDEIGVWEEMFRQWGIGKVGEGMVEVGMRSGENR